MASQNFQFRTDVDDFVADVVHISDTLSNLTYLIDLDAENPGLVRQYATHIEQLVQALGSLARSGEPAECVEA